MRKVIDLNGIWQFAPDLDPEYHGLDHYKDTDWDKANWEPVKVPGWWNGYGEKYSLFEGVGWYAKGFELEEFNQEMIGFLRFGGINYLSRIFLNGALISEHEGGYTEFTVDATSYLKKGENILVIRVDNRRNLIKLPACMGWYNYGGIHGTVSLEISERARIENIFIRAFPVNTLGKGKIWIRVNKKRGDLDDLKCCITIRGSDGKVIWGEQESLSGDNLVVNCYKEFVIKPALFWSPQEPNLYRCIVTVISKNGYELDRIETSFGIRRLTAEGTSLKLNGEHIFLKGLCYPPYHPAVNTHYDETVFSQDVRDFKELELNALRFHFPPDNRLLDKCDQLGILLWLEVPVYCLAPSSKKMGSEFKQQEYVELAKRMISEMIKQAYNHPSVVIWSMGNECNVEHPEAYRFFKELAAQVRDLDPERLVGYASLYGKVGCITEFVDVIGINEFWGWYDLISMKSGHARQLAIETVSDDHGKHFSIEPHSIRTLRNKLDELTHQYKKPIILTECGADAVPGYRSEELKLWSEDYQACYLQATLGIIKEYPQICGAFPFSYNDYPDPSKPISTYWNGLNLKGIVSYSRVKKLAYHTLKRIYHDEKSFL